jgi:magnesium transporter
MIEFIYKRTHDSKAVLRNEFTYGAWVHCELPDDQDLEYLADTFDLDKSLLTDALDINEVPRIEQESGAVYIFTRFVIQQKQTITTTPVLIIYKKKTVITIVPQPIEQIQTLISQQGSWSTYDTEDLTLHFLTILNMSIEKSLYAISRQIQQSRISAEKAGTKELMQFIDLENSCYEISGLLVRMEGLISTLLAKPWFKRTEEEEEKLKDIYLAIQQMLDIVKGNIRTVVNTREAVSTIMTANLNRVIKLFTSLTVLLTVPMLVATFYGMNIQLPLQHSSDAFIFLLTGTGIVSLGLLILFLRKNWL